MKTENSTEFKEFPVKIQSFEEKYQESAYECIVEMKKEVTEGREDKPKERYKNIRENCQRSDKEDFWIAVDENTDKVVGTVGLRFLKDGVGQLIRMGVRSSSRNQGVGHHLIDELMSFAKDKKYKEIYLTTEADDYHKNARDLYESYDFKQAKFDDLSEDTRALVLDKSEVAGAKEGKTIIYKLELEKNK